MTASGISPGRAAYEALQDRCPLESWGPWDSLDEGDRGVWDDVANAVIDADPRWPRCPDGCGCRIGTQDADAHDCGCDGPCTAECRENGYPDAPSYRDLAVKHAMDECDQARALVAEVRAILLEGGQDAATARRRALSAVAKYPEVPGCREPHPGDYRCFDCATDEELAESIPPFPALGTASLKHADGEVTR